jgi:hypothetical protein
MAMCEAQMAAFETERRAAMARWQELCELLLNKELTPQGIVEQLGVKPYRLKQMLESKRLAARLEVVEQIAAMRSDRAILLAVEAAADKLAALAAGEGETGRKACLDVLAQGRLVRTEREATRPNSLLAGLTKWHKGVRKWQRQEQRREEQEYRARETAPAVDVPARRVLADHLGPKNIACEQAVPPRGEEAAAPRATAKARAALAAKPPRRMSKSKLRELAGLPPEKKRPIPVVPPPPGYVQSADFVPRPGGRIVQHLVGGRVVLGST